MRNLVIAIQPCVTTTIIMSALLAHIFFEMDNNAFGEGKKFVDDNNNVKTTMYSQQAIEEVETRECKSPCPSSAEMCIEICA